MEDSSFSKRGYLWTHPWNLWPYPMPLSQFLHLEGWRVDPFQNGGPPESQAHEALVFQGGQFSRWNRVIACRDFWGGDLGREGVWQHRCSILGLVWSSLPPPDLLSSRLRAASPRAPTTPRARTPGPHRPPSRRRERGRGGASCERSRRHARARPEPASARRALNQVVLAESPSLRHLAPRPPTT